LQTEIQLKKEATFKKNHLALLAPKDF